MEFAAQRCRQVCLETYGAAPEVRLSGDLRLRVAYIPAHLDYMLYELLKNAARAAVERHHLGHANNQQRGGGGSGGSGSLSAGAGSSFGGLGGGSGALGQSGYGSSSEAGGGGGGGGEESIPPIHVRVCGSEGEVTIRVSDQGGGLPPGADARVWEFGYSTIDARRGWQAGGGSEGDAAGAGAGSSAREGLGLDSGPGPFAFGAAMSEAESTAGMGRYRMAGLGFGLPLSRLYARYFGEGGVEGLLGEKACLAGRMTTDTFAHPLQPPPPPLRPARRRPAAGQPEGVWRGRLPEPAPPGGRGVAGGAGGAGHPAVRGVQPL